MSAAPPTTLGALDRGFARTGETRRQLAQATARVKDSIGRTLPEETVSALVEISYEELARTAQVENYLLISAERRARERAIQRATTADVVPMHNPHEARSQEVATGALAHLLRRFRPIDLHSVLAAAALQERVDRKYLAEVAEIASVMSMLARSHRVLEIEDRRSSRYSSVYFDTADAHCHVAHVRGRRRRWKARTRRYLDSDLARLELKLKGSRGQTVKLARDIDAGQHGRLDHEGSAFLAESLDAYYGLHLGTELGPIVEVTYRRATLVDISAGQRITLDWNLRFLRLDGEVVGAMRPDAVLVETKSGAVPSYADKLLWSRGVRDAPCSKYCIARMLQGSPYQNPGLRRTVRRWFTNDDGRPAGGLPSP